MNQLGYMIIKLDPIKKKPNTCKLEKKEGEEEKEYRKVVSEIEYYYTSDDKEVDCHSTSGKDIYDKENEQSGSGL